MFRFMSTHLFTHIKMYGYCFFCNLYVKGATHMLAGLLFMISCGYYNHAFHEKTPRGFCIVKELCRGSSLTASIRVSCHSREREPYPYLAIQLQPIFAQNWTWFHLQCLTAWFCFNTCYG